MATHKYVLVRQACIKLCSASARPESICCLLGLSLPTPSVPVLLCDGSWEQFKGVLDEREAAVLRAFTSLEVNSHGRLEVGNIRGICVC